MKHVSISQRGLLLLILLTTGGLTARAQNVGIGTTAPDASAALDIVSSTKGALLPRVTNTQRTSITNPAAGLLVYQTDIPAGFYYNSGTSSNPNWQQIATAVGATVTAGNGLTKTDQNMTLGGTLTGVTTVANAGYNFNITGIGNVGIGTTTTTPIDRIHVATTGVLNVRLRLAATDNVNVGTLYKNSNSEIFTGLTYPSRLPNTTTDNTTDYIIYNNLTNNYLIDIQPGGNMGIGITNPSAKLDVNGSTRLRGLTTAGLVQTDASGNLSSASAANLDPTTASNGLTKTGNNFTLGGILTGATSISQAGNIFALTGGNVGIGTTAPTQTLDVVGGNVKITTSGKGLIFPDGTTQTTAAATATGTNFIQNGTTQQTASNFNISGTGTMGNAIVTGNFTLGNGTPLTSIIRATVNKTVGDIGNNNAVDINFDVPNATVGSTVFISPASNLTIGANISYARVSGPGVVTARFSSSAGNINVAAIDYYLTVIR